MSEESDRLVIIQDESRTGPNTQPNLTAHTITEHSGKGPASNPASEDLIGVIVPDAAFAWNRIAEHNRCITIAMTLNRLRQRPRAILVGSALLVSIGLGWVGACASLGLALYRQENGDEQARGYDVCLVDKAASMLTEARAFLLQTASPSYTMVKQGPEFAINRLHPEFAIRLAEAIREARDAGLFSAGVYSAYRPPAFGVGGFSDKFNSLHAYGLAVDMFGIGKPGSAEARHWHEVAARHGVICPYGPYHKTEWNHCQPTALKKIWAGSPLRETITANGPVSLEAMFEAGDLVVESLTSATEKGQQVQTGILKAEASGTCPQSFAVEDVPVLYGLVPGQFSFKETGSRGT
jgi:hypothetical protein